jgi:hypothetical protein
MIPPQLCHMLPRVWSTKTTVEYQDYIRFIYITEEFYIPAFGIQIAKVRASFRRTLFFQVQNLFFFLLIYFTSLF